MIEVHDAPVNGVRNIRLNQSEKVELVDGQDRRLPFSIETYNAAKLSVSVRPGGMAQTFRCVNNLSGIVGFWRVSPLEVELEEWGGQIGQMQTVTKDTAATGVLTITEADVIIPPAAQGMAISLQAGAAVGYCRYGRISFPTAGYQFTIPFHQSGVYICPLLASTFTLAMNMAALDGSGALGVVSETVLISFLADMPSRAHMEHGKVEFSSATDIAASSTFTFALENIGAALYKRIVGCLTIRYEDDANTAGGNLIFYPRYTPAVGGGVAYATIAFPLGTDIGAARQSATAFNLVDPTNEDGSWIAIQNLDAGKKITAWSLSLYGVDWQ